MSRKAEASFTLDPRRAFCMRLCHVDMRGDSLGSCLRKSIFQSQSKSSDLPTSGCWFRLPNGNLRFQIFLNHQSGPADSTCINSDTADSQYELLLMKVEMKLLPTKSWTLTGLITVFVSPLHGCCHRCLAQCNMSHGCTTPHTLTYFEFASGTDMF